MQKEKKLYKVLKSSMSKDATRIHLNGFYHCPELRSLVATDGYTMTVLGTKFDENLAGKIILIDELRTIDAKFPKCSAVIPRKSNKRLKITFPKHLKIKSKKPTYIYIYEDMASVERLENRLPLAAVDSNLILDLCDGSTYFIDYLDKMSPLKIYLNGTSDLPLESDFVLVMPLKFE